MGDIKAGEPFGIDADALASIDWKLANERIRNDLKTDFIYAPHLSFIFNRAATELIADVTSSLKNGTFSPGVPITIEVPKSYRMRVATTGRLGPNYSRPGSILLPRDRIFYQALADRAALTIEANTDKLRSYSHRLAPPDSSGMFLPTRTCWSKLQKALKKFAELSTSKYILKLDVTNFFGSINLHMLINVLNDAGLQRSFSSRLEAMLTGYTGSRSSRGILQGMYPSDLFGNYYLAPIDEFLDEQKVKSARYVDDIYIFVQSVRHAEEILREIIPKLRIYGLAVNEAKSVVMPVSALHVEEPDLEELFEDAVKEIADQINDDDFDVDYGFQSEWADDEQDEEGSGNDEENENDEEKLELGATKLLFDSLEQYSGHEENIERYCLPLFTKAGSDYALDHVMESFKKRPAMSQIYASYLSNFFNQEDVYGFMVDLLGDDSLLDWQRMWILAALSQVRPEEKEPIKRAYKILKDADRHEALRAVAAIYVGRYGDHTKRIDLMSLYASVSNYIQAAIYYSSKYWPGVERSNAKATWSNHGPLHSLLTIAMAKRG